MIKRGNKSGQFYIIAAVILTLIILGIVTIANYLTRSSDVKIEELKEEIKIESSKVMDYVLENEFDQNQKYETFMNFTRNYADYQGKDKDIYFLFGNVNNMTVAGSQKEANTVFLNDNFVTDSSGEFVGSIILNAGEENINLLINKDSYDFKLNAGENFYFVISKKFGDEEYIIQE